MARASNQGNAALPEANVERMVCKGGDDVASDWREEKQRNSRVVKAVEGLQLYPVSAKSNL